MLLQRVQASALDVVNRELFDKMFAHRMLAYAVQLEVKSSSQEERNLPNDLKQLLQEFQVVF